MVAKNEEQITNTSTNNNNNKKNKKMPYGQLVLGPPGSGKTTYSCGMREFMRLMDRRVVVVSLDPANGRFWSSDLEDNDKTDLVDIEELVSADRVAKELHLGPNGSMIFCIEFLQSHIAWLVNKINSFDRNVYFLIDLPGQVELVTHHTAIASIVYELRKQCNLQLCAVHLVDSSICTDAGKFISSVLLSLITMIRLELPHINVLSKVDLLQADALDFPLEFYTEMYNPSLLIDVLKSSSAGGARFAEKHRKLNEALLELIETHQLVAFSTLNVQDPESMMNIYHQTQKALGLEM